ncbi:MAG: hypothetical protein V4850_09565 [Myxococcota bacterium]
MQVDARTLDVGQEERSRYSHVVKHLYARVERWDLAVPELARELRGRAGLAGCTPANLGHGWRWPSVCQDCREHVLGDHARHYLPAAIDAVRTGALAGNHREVETAQGRRELFVGDNAVQVLLRTPAADGSQAFLTALRDPPSGRNPTNEDFYRRAVRKMRDKASLGSGGTR